MLAGDQNSTEPPEKTCPSCEAKVPRDSRECPLCGYVWQQGDAPDDDRTALADFSMAEIDLLQHSAFPWCDLFDDDRALVATGFDAWSGIFYLNDRWYGLGGTKHHGAQLLAKGERTVCLAAADDWLNTHESDQSAHKSHKWFNQSATLQQLRYLPNHYRRNFGLTRYRASCLLAFQFNAQAIKSRIFRAAGKMAA